MTKVEIYTTMLCGYCGAAKRLLAKKGVDFTEYDVMFKPGLRAKMMERTGGATSVPQIFIDDVAIGGFDELMDLEQDDKLDAMLEATP
ncbi:MAG: glutaredoxin 3 [Proteobacteria bacterium]|nr:glutaredoxin 3 [Pseudomonadota bacterium]